MNMWLALNSARLSYRSGIKPHSRTRILTAKSDATQLPPRPGAGGGKGGCDAARTAAPSPREIPARSRETPPSRASGREHGSASPRHRQPPHRPQHNNWGAQIGRAACAHEDVTFTGFTAAPCAVFTTAGAFLLVAAMPPPVPAAQGGSSVPEGRGEERRATAPPGKQRGGSRTPPARPGTVSRLPQPPGQLGHRPRPPLAPPQPPVRPFPPAPGEPNKRERREQGTATPSRESPSGGGERHRAPGRWRRASV